MEVSEFISGTLVQIANGIDEANRQLGSGTARVNPTNVQPYGEKGSGDVYGHINTDPRFSMNTAVHLIRFDVAVYAAEGAEKKGGIGIMVGSIGIGGQAKSEATASTTSRIQFGIPMLLPTSK